MKRAIFIISLIIISGPLFSQAWMQYLPQEKTENEVTFYDYKNAFNQWCLKLKIDHEGYYINSSGVRQKAYGWKQFKRWEIVVEGTYDPKTGRFLDEVIGSEINRHFDAMQANRNIGGNWTNIAYSEEGDGNNGNGRINCVAFHPTDPNTFWIGAAWGGIWSTTDHGETWTPLSDFIKAIGIGSIGIPNDYSTSHTIYLGTGDRGYIRDRGIGLLKSTNSGATWENTGLVIPEPESFYILRILIDPSNSNIIYAGTTRGLCKSIDAGVTWDTLNLNKIADMEFNPVDPQTIYAGTRHTDGDDSTRIIVSTDGGLNWDTVFTVRGNRTELAVSADDPSVVYGISGAHGGAMKAIAKSVDAGETFTMIIDGDIPGNNLTCGCNPNGEGGLSHYDLAIAADPENADVVFIGGIEAWKSSDGGASWVLNTDGYGNCTSINLNVHVDQHYHAFQPVTNDFFICSDGGIYYSTNNGNSYTNISGGLTINQPYRIGCTFVAGEILMGQQDNGIVLSSNGDVSYVGGGDGGTAVINPESISKQYFTNNSRGVWGTLNHWDSFFDIYPANDSSDNWFKPIIVLPPDTVLIGYTDLWRSHDNGQTLFKVHDFDEPGNMDDIAVAASNHKVMVVDFNNHIYKTTNGGDTWTDMTSVWGVVPDNCSETVFKHDDPDVIWITDIQWGDGMGVLRSDDGGLTWENISEGLPDASFSDIIQNKNQTNYEELYVCGFFGVFLKLGDNPWVPFNNGLPNVVSFDMDAHYIFSNGKLRTGTHGRGVWETDFYSAEANMPGIWTGVYSTDWHDSRNWQYLEVPAADETVNIPGGCPHNPHIYLNNAYCTSVTLDSGAILTMSARRLYVSEDAYIDGKIKMIGNATAISMTGDMTWGDDADFENGGTNCYIETEGDWIFESGCKADLSGINVTFKGSTYAQLFCHSSLCSFGQLTVDKPSPYNLSFKSSSIADLNISGHFIITATSKFFHQADRKLKVGGNLDAQGDFYQQNGTFVCTSTGTINLVNSASYFHNFELNHSGSSDLLTDIDVRGNLEVISGMLNLSSHTLPLQGDLNGTDGAIESTTGKLVFNGISEQKASGDVQVKFAVLDMTADSLRILSDADIIIDSLDWTQGAITVSQNANLTINELADNGIFGTYRVRNGSTLNISNPTGSVNLSGKLFITGGNVNVYGGDMASRWPGSANAELHISSGTLDFKDRGILVQDHPTLTFLDNITGGVIRTSRGFDGDHHAFTPVGGYIELYGPGDAELGHGIGSSFYQIVINKESVTDEVTVTSNLDIDNNLDIEEGDLDINGYTVDMDGALDIRGKLTMINAASTINAGTTVTWRPGSSSYILGGLITFNTIWSFQDGTSAMLAGTNTVKVIGSQFSIIQHKDPDARFNNLIIEKTGSMTTLDEQSTHDLQLNENLTVKSGNSLRVLNADVWLAGTFLAENNSTVLLSSGGSIDAGTLTVQNNFNVVNGSILTGDNLAVEGTLNLTDGGNTAFENLTLSGTLDINAGSVLVHNSFSQATGGILTLDGGSFIIDKPYTGNYMSFSGTTNLNGGFFEISYDGIQFGTGAVVNFNGGNLRIGGNFRAIQANSFQPSSGAVELINTIGASIECENGNYFHQLIINKNIGTSPCMLLSPVTIQDDLALQSGELSTMNQTLTVNEDLLINTSGKLTAGSSEIYVGGDWTNNRGMIGFSEGTSSVWMISGQTATLSSETFNYLDIDKPLMTGDYLSMADNSTLTVANKMTLGDGVLLMGNNCTINANGTLHFKSGGGISGNPSASGNVINVKGHWWDYNTFTTSDQGFFPGYTTVCFNGTANQDLLATGGVTFHHLTFQNPGNSIFINDDVTVNGNFNIVSGRWYQVASGLTHTFKGHFTIPDPTSWYDAVNTVSFEGSGAQNLVNSSGQGWLEFGTLQADRPLNFAESGIFGIQSDISCTNRLIIANGETSVDDYRIMCTNGVDIESDGQLNILGDASVAMGNDASLHVDGGILYAPGTEADRPLFTRISTGYYEFLVENGGSINASYSDFEYMDGRGVNVYTNGFIGGSLPFNHCTFSKGEASGTLLQINNSQDITLYNIDFPANTWSGSSNIAKTENTGQVIMDNATGAYAGPLFEDDVFGRIHWPSSGIWDGDVSSEWHNVNNWRYNSDYPGTETNVVIPSGTTYTPVLQTQAATVRSLLMAPGTRLDITNFSLTAGDWADISGHLYLGDVAGNVSALFCDSLTWQSGSNATFTDRGSIYITGDMLIRHGSDLHATNGEFRFTGNGDSRLICRDTAQIYHLSNYKNAGYSLELTGDTVARLTIGGAFRNGPGATLECPSTQEWVFAGNFRNTDNGHFRCANGTFRFKGPVTSTYFRVKQGDYFNNLTIETTSRINLYTTTGYSDTLRVNGNLVFNNPTSGTSGITANNFKIMLMGHWTNNASSSAFQAGTSRVVFWHPWDVQEVHGNNTFNVILTANDPDGHTRFYDNNTITELIVYFPAVAYGILNVTNMNIDDSPSEIVMMEGSNVQVGTLEQGGKVISFGGSFTATDLLQDYITGTYTVNNGLVSLGQNYSPTATHDLNFANITITGGELRFTGGNGVSLWPRTPGVATVTMSDGVFDLTNQEVVIKPTGFTENVSGGMIRTFWSFSADPTATSFHPTGGTVELYGTEDCSFSMPEPNCWFYNLYLNKTDGGGAYPSSSMRIKNEFRLKTGSYMETDGYTITVGP